MSPDQMIAWLTIEGYQPYRSQYWSGCSDGKLFYCIYLDHRKGRGAGCTLNAPLKGLLPVYHAEWGDPYEVAELYERVVNDVRD